VGLQENWGRSYSSVEVRRGGGGGGGDGEMGEFRHAKSLQNLFSRDRDDTVTHFRKYPDST
jgi:hypothetical protein